MRKKISEDRKNKMAITSRLSPERIIQKGPSPKNGFLNFIAENPEPSLNETSTTTDAVTRPEVQANNNYIRTLIQNLSTNIFERFNFEENRTEAVNKNIITQVSSVINDLSTKINTTQNEFSTQIQKITSAINQIEPIRERQSILEREIQKSSSAIVARTSSAITGTTPSSTSIAEQVTQEVQANTQNIIQSNITVLSRETQGILDTSLQRFLTDYSEKIRGLEDAKPKNILNRFIKVYNNAISFANYFGDSENIEVVSRNLSALRDIFNESFKVAKMVRQTIVKIVSQLSNLPRASGGSGNMNLDINVPGGMLKQAAPDTVKNVRAGRMRMLGKVALGGLAVAGTGAAAYAVSQSGKSEEFTRTELERSREMLAASEREEGILGIRNSISSFSEISERLSKSLEDMIDYFRKGGNRGKEGEEEATKSSPAAPGSSPGGGTSGEWGPLLDLIKKAEMGSAGYESMNPSTSLPGATKMTIGEVSRKATGAVGAYQFLPHSTLLNAMRGANLKETDLFSPENQDKMAIYLIEKTRGVTKELIKNNPDEAMLRLSKEWAGLPMANGRSYYAGVGNNAATVTPEEVRKVFKQLDGASSGNSPTSNVRSSSKSGINERPTGSTSPTGSQSSSGATPASANIASATPITSSQQIGTSVPPKSSVASAPIAINYFTNNNFEIKDTSGAKASIAVVGGANNFIINGGGGGSSAPQIVDGSRGRVSVDTVASSNISDPYLALTQPTYNTILA